jgi:hypothetical protein
MIAQWMVYCVAVSALLALSSLALEHGLLLRRLPLRWVWVGALLGSFTLAAAPWYASPQGTPVTHGTIPLAHAADARWIAVIRQPAPSQRPVFRSPEQLNRPLLLAWMILSGAGLVVLWANHRCLLRKRGRWRWAVVDGVPAMISRNVGPAVIGIIAGTIVLPKWVLEMEHTQRRLVVAHEEEHLRAGDVHLLALAYVMLALMPWNAPLWWQVRRLRDALEMDCDARVLKGCRDLRGYSSLLVEIGERQSMRAVGVAAFGESGSLLERRVRNMLTPRTTDQVVALRSCVVAALGLLLLACEAPYPTMPAAERRPEYVRQVDPTTPAARLPEVPTTSSEGPQMSAQAEDRAPTIGTAEFRHLGFHEIRYLDLSPGDVRAMIEQLRPDIAVNGLPLDDALWIVIGEDGKVLKAWIAPNFWSARIPGSYAWKEAGYDEHRPLAPATDRELAEQERRWQEVLQSSVPDIEIRAGYFGLLSHVGTGTAVVNIVKEGA